MGVLLGYFQHWIESFIEAKNCQNWRSLVLCTIWGAIFVYLSDLWRDWSYWIHVIHLPRRVSWATMTDVGIIKVFWNIETAFLRSLKCILAGLWRIRMHPDQTRAQSFSGSWSAVGLEIGTLVTKFERSNIEIWAIAEVRCFLGTEFRSVSILPFNRNSAAKWPWKIPKMRGRWKIWQIRW